MKPFNSTSLRKNFAYKGVLTIANPLMGMVTFPYVSRILGVGNIGIVNFVDNTVSYFLLFATMGIATLGVREIAGVKSDINKLNKTFSNLIGLNLLFTIASLAIYIYIISLVPRFSEHDELFYLGSAKILFTSLTIEWFFSGLEDFKYITIRSILIRLMFIISIFLFVKKPNDYKLYFILTICVVIINALINIRHSKKYVKIIYRELLSFKYLRENINLGIYTIMTSMYLTFNVMYLGVVSNDVEVGYYTSAFKLYQILLSVFTAFTSVMLPRMSYLIGIGNNKQFKSYINKSLEFVFIFAIPVIICSCILSPEIIYVLCGKGYEGAVLPMRIIMPSILFVALSQIIAIQILLPLRKDKILLRNSIIGAILSLLINILIVPIYQSVGSSIVLIFSEFTVTSIYVIVSYKLKFINIPLQPFLNSILKCIPCALICIACKVFINNPFISLLLSLLLSIPIYLLLNFKKVRELM